ncbi:hypothetical protein BDV25DRAFT_155887 [Aspergillus avenaceus]|uniref:Indoleamine 2,3-dioxygenase n=1 Tax=Aspergillus avenaceus TaxID=36643 RepID=A0A5N6TUA0_ASPAV|nr:hypothetical protein BDV25DRAFT_155887 [Aspergillus avenaceus]
MSLFLLPFPFIIALLLVLAWRRRTQRLKADATAWQIQNIKSMKRQGAHETATLLADLIENDGAGAWPPKTNYGSWPEPLRAYKDIYLELVPTLPAANPSLDDDVNQEKRNKYRMRMRKLLSERVDIVGVEKLMIAAAAGDTDAFPRDVYNAFYCCIAVCRHAYRWATIPVVKVAQLEKIVDFPPELDVPWPYLQRSFRVDADSGNNTANVLHNFDENGERVFKINVGLNELITSSEDAFFRLFYDLEVLAMPIYYDMIRAVVCFEENDTVSCLTHLQNITFRVRTLLKVFYDGLTASRVSKEVWLSYVQGFQGWGVGRMINGEYVKFDGLSGNHVLIFQALDAFLGIGRYLSDENMDRYIPGRQRDLCVALKKHSFRGKLKGPMDCQIEEEFKKIVNHMKLFRSAHRTRVMPYLEQPAPERLTMTAGKSVLEGPDAKSALKVLDDMLVTRLKQTA